MPIPYFTNRVFKKPHAIDRVLAQREIKSVRNTANVTSFAIDEYIHNETDWQIDSIKFNFSNATPRNYTVFIATGATVVAERNDFMFFEVTGCGRNKVVLTPGFYSGDGLAVELETQLNALAVFSTKGITFTVVYNDITGQFEISCTSGQNIRYIDFDNGRPLPNKKSIAGYLFGFNANSDYLATIYSDTLVYGLNNEAWIIEETASDVTSHFNDDMHILSVNQAIHITSNTAPDLIVSYEVNYEDMV